MRTVRNSDLLAGYLSKKVLVHQALESELSKDSENWQEELNKPLMLVMGTGLLFIGIFVGFLIGFHEASEMIRSEIGRGTLIKAHAALIIDDRKLKNGNGDELSAGDLCIVEQGGTIEMHKVGETYLSFYTSTGSSERKKACPNHVMIRGINPDDINWNK